MVANIITLTRLVLTFVVIVLFSTCHTLGITLLAAIPIIFGLDAVDGIISVGRGRAQNLPITSSEQSSLQTEICPDMLSSKQPQGTKRISSPPVKNWILTSLSPISNRE